MKINTKFWLIIIIVSVFVILVKNYPFNRTKNYIFNRKICDNLVLSKSNENFSITGNPTVDITDKYISSYKSSQDTTVVCFYDLNNFSEIDKFNLINPNFRQITYFNRNSVLFIDKFVLYHFLINKKSTNAVGMKNFKVFNAISLNAESSKLLLFGELKLLSKYQTGFYIFDTLTNEIKLSKMLESNKHTLAPQNFLSYSGKFSRNDSIINYSCDKFSEIYFFNDYGKFEKKITTKDSTPKPKIVNNNSAYYYKRGNTYNTNNGVLIFGDSLLVFSSRTVKKDVIMIDLYSYKTGNYLCSNELSHNNKTSTDINFVSKNKNKLIIGFDEGIYTFNNF